MDKLDVITERFSALVGEMNGGLSDHKLSEKLQQCIKAVQETGKKATVTYKLTIVPETRDAGQVSLEDDIIAKIPELGRGKTLRFTTPDGRLSKRDPNQGEFEFENE